MICYTENMDSIIRKGNEADMEKKRTKMFQRKIK